MRMLVLDPSGSEGALAFFGQTLAGFPLDVLNEGSSLLLAFLGGEFCPTRKRSEFKGLLFGVIPRPDLLAASLGSVSLGAIEPLADDGNTVQEGLQSTGPRPLGGLANQVLLATMTQS
jgi:hypothetical protein